MTHANLLNNFNNYMISQKKKNTPILTVIQPSYFILKQAKTVFFK